jgi:hypothetical protein
MKEEATIHVKPMSSRTNESDPQAQSLNYQLEFLKLEFDAIHQTIKRIDEISQTIKNWAILTWAGSISLAISTKELRPYVVLTAVLPFLFWLVDGRWRRIQRQFFYREQRISDFLNGPQLVESFKKCTLINFKVLDPRGNSYKGTLEYEEFISYSKAMRFITIGVIYLWLIGLSMVLGFLFIFVLRNA